MPGEDAIMAPWYMGLVNFNPDSWLKLGGIGSFVTHRFFRKYHGCITHLTQSLREYHSIFREFSKGTRGYMLGLGAACLAGGTP